MANLKSSQKDVRRIKRRTQRNVVAKSRLKTLTKKVKTLASSNDPKLKDAARELVSALDKATKGHLIHPNKANRAKAQIAKIAKV